MYKIVNSEKDKMNDKQAELNEFMISFDKIPL